MIIQQLHILKWLIGSFAGLLKKRLISITLLSVLATGSTMLGLILIMPLTSYLTSNSTELSLLSLSIPVTDEALSILLVSIFILILTGIQLRYQFHLVSFQVMKQTIIESTVRGIQHLFKKHASNIELKSVRVIINTLSYSCGHILRHFSEVVSDLLTIPIYLFVLFWINPWITFLFLALLLIAFSINLQSLNEVTKAVEDRTSISNKRRREQEDFVQNLIDSSLNRKDIRKSVEEMYVHGFSGHMIDNKLGIRRQRKKGPMAVEYLFPLSVILIPIYVVFTGDIRTEVVALIPYIFILRSFIGTFKGIMGSLVVMGKFYTSIECYHLLITDTVLPTCLNTSIRTEEDELNSN